MTAENAEYPIEIGAEYATSDGHVFRDRRKTPYQVFLIAHERKLMDDGEFAILYTMWRECREAWEEAYGHPGSEADKRYDKINKALRENASRFYPADHLTNS